MNGKPYPLTPPPGLEPRAAFHPPTGFGGRTPAAAHGTPAHARQLDPAAPRQVRLVVLVPPVTPARPGLAVRPVKGEVLSNGRGGWFERQGDQVHELGELLAGPDRLLYELLPPQLARMDERTSRTNDSLPHTGPDANHDAIGPTPHVTPPPPTTSNRAARPGSVVRLFGEQGVRRLVRWGDYRTLVGPQLAHPDRLRCDHALPCRVDVFESTVAQSHRDLIAAIDLLSPSTPIAPLTTTDLQRLLLEGLAPATAPLAEPAPAAGEVQPGQLFFSLRLEQDPTARSTRTLPATGREPAPRAAQPGASPEPAEPAQIPARFLRPWEFRCSREQALLEIARRATWWGRLAAWIGRLTRRSEFRRWQLLLAGRTPEEQLWAVAPPAAWLGTPLLRDWARQTLVLAGSDSQSMLTEWEAFWLRRCP